VSVAKADAALIGAGAAACAVCCTGPILGFMAAIGLGAIAGTLLFGVAALAVTAVAGALLLVRRRRRRAACEAPPLEQPVTVGPARIRQM
jgi:Ca2+/Na+ antiporter